MNSQSNSSAQDASSELIPRSLALLISSWVVLAALIGGASIATIMTVHFEEVFSSFDAEIPALTFVFLKGRLLWWVLPAIALAAALLITIKTSHQKKRQCMYAWGLATLLIVSLITASVGIFAMYLPIFNPGNVVQ
jgi:type II secretory pathway component PulF